MATSRRAAIAGLFAAAEALAQQKGNNAPVTPKESLRITKLETFLVKPRWLFLKIHTNAGITGLGEPIVDLIGDGRVGMADLVVRLREAVLGDAARPAG